MRDLLKSVAIVICVLCSTVVGQSVRLSVSQSAS